MNFFQNYIENLFCALLSAKTREEFTPQRNSFPIYKFVLANSPYFISWPVIRGASRLNRVRATCIMTKNVMRTVVTEEVITKFSGLPTMFDVLLSIQNV